MRAAVVVVGDLGRSPRMQYHAHALAASGVDVASIVNGLNQPLPLVRFSLLAQKASELAQEVKGLGGALLTALEKEDTEALGILRAHVSHHALERDRHVA